MIIKNKSSLLFLSVLLFFVFTSTNGSAQTVHNIAAVPLTPNVPAVLRFELSNNDITSSKCQFGLVFPAAFDLSSVLFADSRTLNGGFTIASHQDTVWVYRSGVGNPLPAREKMDILVATVGMPADITQPFPFTVIIRDSVSTKSKNIRMKLTGIENR